MKRKRMMAGVLAWVALAMMGSALVWAEGGNLTAAQIFNGQVVAAGRTADSETLDLLNHRVEGYFSLQVWVTGTGTCSITYLLSNDGVNFMTPTTGSAIATGVSTASGPGADGKHMVSFNPMLARYMKIRITETGGSTAVTVTAWVAMQ